MAPHLDDDDIAGWLQPPAHPLTVLIAASPAPQGINAQYGGSKEDAVGYAQWLEQQPLFKVRARCFSSLLWGCGRWAMTSSQIDG